MTVPEVLSLLDLLGQEKQDAVQFEAALHGAKLKR